MSGTRGASHGNTPRRPWVTLLAICLVLGPLLVVRPPSGTSGSHAGTLPSLLPGPRIALAAPSEAQIVRVGYYENEVFQEGASEGAVKTGYAYEYYQKLSEYTGWKYEYEYGSYADLYQALLDGDIDVLAGLAWREERVGLMRFPDEPMGNETYNLVKHEGDATISADPSTLSGKRIGILDSAMVGVLESYLDNHGVTADVTTFQDYVTLFQAFDEDKVDVLAAEGDGAYKRDNAEFIGIFGSSDYYLCVSKGRPDLLAQLNTAQAQIALDQPDYISSLRAKYYSSSVSSRAFSTEESSWIASHDRLCVGYLDHYLPYSGTDEQGQASGIVQELVPKMLANLGIGDIEVSYRGFTSFDDMITAVGTGDVDAIFPVGGSLYHSEENGIHLSTPLVSVPEELVYLGEYDQGTTAHFAVNENNRTQEYYIRSHFPDARISFYPSIEGCLDAVMHGEVSCTTLNALRASDILRNSRYDTLSLVQLSWADDQCFGVSIGNGGLLKLLNRGISTVGEDNAVNLAYKYTNSLYTYTLVDMLRDHMVPFVCLILGVAGLVIGVLVRDARRSKRQQRELSDALLAAEHANRAKTVFLNNMSHDIRTPMNAIIGFTSLAESHVDDREQVLDYLDKISVSSQHLLSLINDVLDMSRIESGKMTIEEGEVHLPDVIHGLKTIIQSSVDAKQQELFIDTQDVVNEDIVTDKLRLNQVLLNILSNAVKFTPAGGTISLRVIEHPCETPGMADFEFRIKDNGIGMSEEFQKTIFEPFARERTSTVSGIQGTGLGMSITKNIVDMMGGTIEVSSVEGEGTEFIVRLQCEVCDKGASFEQVPELKGLRVLVADDDTNTCLSVSAMLRQLGMRPDWTNYGREAVIRAKDALDCAEPFGTYIIDWRMTDLNGVETVRRIRKAVDDDAPIIILTAYDWSDIEAEAREAGVTAFCSKPLFMSELRDVLVRQHQGREVAKETPEPDPVQAVDFSGRRILLAEDNSMNQQIANAILTNVGFEVEIASDGTDAVELMERMPAGHYDVILMDIQMPQMDGYEATRRIRALDDPAKSGIPIVAVTANAFEEDRQEAFEAGMDDHLAKPYEIPTMMETLARILGGRT